MAVGAGLLAAVKMMWPQGRVERLSGIWIADYSWPVLDIVATMAAAFSMAAFSLPVILSLFGSPGASRTVPVIWAGGRAPCANPFQTKETTSSFFPKFICLSDEQRRLVDLDGGSEAEITITGFGNEFGLWFPGYEPVRKEHPIAEPSSAE